MSARKKSHPLESLTFTAPKLDEVSPAVEDGQQAAAVAAVEAPKEGAKAGAEVETRASNVILPVTVWDWIDAKHAEARRDGGKAVRKAAVIRAVFEAVMGLEFDLSGSQSEEEIVRRIQRAIGRGGN
jgi:hypothetical protein